jgi:hypothetical protein
VALHTTAWAGSISPYTHSGVKTWKLEVFYFLIFDSKFGFKSIELKV